MRDDAVRAAQLGAVVKLIKGLRTNRLKDADMDKRGTEANLLMRASGMTAAQIRRLASKRPSANTRQPAAPEGRTLDTLVSMLRAGQLAPDELTDSRCIANRMLVASGKTVAEVLKLAGKTATTPAPAGSVRTLERRIMHANEQR